MTLNAVVFEDDFAVITRPVAGLPGVFVKICGPGIRHNWNGALPPHEAPIERVTWDEWCDVQDGIGPEDREVTTDLILEKRYYGGSTRLVWAVNLWDPRGRRWVLMSEADAAIPYSARERLPKAVARHGFVRRG